MMKFEPFAQMNKVFETWQKMTEDTIARANAFYGEVEKAESKRVAHFESAIDELAKMQKETLAYGAQLAGEWRKVALESMQKASTFASSAVSPTAN